MKNRKTIIDLLIIVLFLLSNNNIIASEMDNNPKNRRNKTLNLRNIEHLDLICLQDMDY